MLDRLSLISKSRKVKAVDLPGIGQINIRELTAGEVSEYIRLIKSKPEDELSLLTWIVAKCVVDDQGKPLFADGDDSVNTLPLSTLKTIAEHCAGFSGLGQDPAAKKNDVQS